MLAYNQVPQKIMTEGRKAISVFSATSTNANVDTKVVEGFGEEWLKFNDFSNLDINKSAGEYFDILNETILNKNTYVLDAGCGTGRWSRYLADKADFIEAMDPSDAIFAADKMLADVDNIRLSKATIDNIPFPNESFDLVMSIGVLHHIPNTQQAIADCVRKVKRGGFFYAYIYYSLDNRSILYRLLFRLINMVRVLVSKLPSCSKKVVCDLLAVLFYMPWILAGRFLTGFGLGCIARKLPLYYYHNKSFYIIRNDALDRFGTQLEHRFSKKEIIQMFENVGLNNIVVSPKMPFWHLVAQKK